jgi:dienelactone hydrolase
MCGNLWSNNLDSGLIPLRRSRLSASGVALCLAHLCALAANTRLLAADPIVPSEKLPASSPWDLKKLSEAPAFEWIDANGLVRSLYYNGEQFRGHPTRVFAYYASPATLDPETAKGNRYPAVVLLHGGGGTAFRDWTKLWAKRGYAAIAMDLAGHQPIEGKSPYDVKNLSQLADGGPDQAEEGKFGSIEKPLTEQWTFHAVSAALRAHSLIRSFPEVDRDHTAVTGISWGGYLTLIVAGVDSRFKAAVPVYGCGHLEENSAWLKHFAKMTPEGRERWAKLWDPSMYVPAINMPILYMNGTNDRAYPLDSYMKTYHDSGGAKQIRITIKMPHSHQDGWAPAEIGMFIDHVLNGGRALPEINEVTRKEQKIAAKYKSDGKVTAALNFTTDQAAVNEHEWQSEPATINDGIIVAELPSKEITAWFLTVTDDCNATTSTEVFFK